MSVLASLGPQLCRFLCSCAPRFMQFVSLCAVLYALLLFVRRALCTCVFVRRTERRALARPLSLAVCQACLCAKLSIALRYADAVYGATLKKAQSFRCVCQYGGTLSIALRYAVYGTALCIAYRISKRTAFRCVCQYGTTLCIALRCAVYGAARWLCHAWCRRHCALAHAREAKPHFLGR